MTKQGYKPLLLPLIVFLCYPAKADAKCRKYSKTLPKIYVDVTVWECTDRNGRLHGATKAWWKDHPKNQLFYKGQYWKGKKTGTWRYFHTSGGGKMKVEKWKRGKKVGTWTKWHYGGVVARRVSFRNGKMHGFDRLWWGSGKLKFEQRYNNGKPAGPQRGWHRNGTKQYVAPYRNGKEHGVTVWWDKNGKVVERCKYRNGKEMGCI